MSRYKELLRSKVASAIAQAKAAQKYIDHNGLKGEIIEILIRELFRPLLPADVGVSTGQIIDSKGRISTQQDIIIYDVSIIPPVLFENQKGLFPIECVLYTIEIKTTLTAAELETSHNSATKLRDFEYLIGNELNTNPDRVRSVLFAINSDLSTKGKSEAQRYKEIYGENYPYIRAICVAGKEYWHESNGFWLKHPVTNEYDEILSFIGGIMNTYKAVAINRGNPCLGHYIIDDQSKNEPVILASGTSKIIKLRCNKCNALSIDQLPSMEILNVGGEIKSKNNCSCGGEYLAPSGKYQLLGGEYIRIGDYEPPTES